MAIPVSGIIRRFTRGGNNGAQELRLTDFMSLAAAQVAVGLIERLGADASQRDGMPTSSSAIRPAYIGPTCAVATTTPRPAAMAAQ